ncbi:MAG: helix-turn-helix domain-containing protein [Minisyncoccia bacterium]
MPDEITSNLALADMPAVSALETAQMESSAVVTPEPALEPQTAQMGGNEPFTRTLTETQTTPTEPVIETTPEPIVVEAPAPAQTQIEATPLAQVETPAPAPAQVIAQTLTKSIRELFTKAQLAIQNRKRKKIDRVMNLFAKQTTITNNEVEKLLHVSDATATRYLSTLEKEGKIKQSGKTGKGVSYSKI